MAVDGAGNLFIADTGNHRIRRVDPTGTITTVTGTGEYGFSGDGGPADQAQLDFPSGVAVDGAGNLFIADYGNHRIRRVDRAGTITTVAGTGRRGFSGDGGPADQAWLYSPHGVAVDGAGNLFIADQYNHRIRRVDPTGTITTVAGTGECCFGGDGGPADQAQLNDPDGVAVDGAGNLFIADTDNHRIRRVDPTGTITTVAGTGRPGFSGDGGPADQALLRYPSGVAVDGAGNLFIADTSNGRIRRVDPAGTITTVAGGGEGAIGFIGDGGPADQARLGFTFGVAVDGAGNLFIADTGNHRIRKVDPAGTITTVAGTGECCYSGDGGPAVEAVLNPKGVAVDGAGNLFIADPGNHRIRVLTPALDFAHFANGASVTSDLVLVNVEAVTIHPTLYFYDGAGAALDAESVVEVSGDLETTDDKGLTVDHGNRAPGRTDDFDPRRRGPGDRIGDGALQRPRRRRPAL